MVFDGANTPTLLEHWGRLVEQAARKLTSFPYFFRAGCLEPPCAVSPSTPTMTPRTRSPALSASRRLPTTVANARAPVRWRSAAEVEPMSLAVGERCRGRVRQLVCPSQCGGARASSGEREPADRQAASPLGRQAWTARRRSARTVETATARRKVARPPGRPSSDADERPAIHHQTRPAPPRPAPAPAPRTTTAPASAEHVPK